MDTLASYHYWELFYGVEDGWAGDKWHIVDTSQPHNVIASVCGKSSTASIPVISLSLGTMPICLKCLMRQLDNEHEATLQTIDSDSTDDSYTDGAWQVRRIKRGEHKAVGHYGIWRNGEYVGNHGGSLQDAIDMMTRYQDSTPDAPERYVVLDDTNDWVLADLQEGKVVSHFDSTVDLEMWRNRLIGKTRYQDSASTPDEAPKRYVVEQRTSVSRGNYWRVVDTQLLHDSMINLYDTEAEAQAVADELNNEVQS